jgi:hypothetical protein
MARDEATEMAHSWAKMVEADHILQRVLPRHRADVLASLAKLLGVDPAAILEASKREKVSE